MRLKPLAEPGGVKPGNHFFVNAVDAWRVQPVSATFGEEALVK